MILKIIFFFIAIATLFLSAYTLYLNLPLSLSDARERFIDVNYTPSHLKFSYAEQMQFYPNMRFSQLPISYGFDSECSKKRRENIQQAADLLTSKTPVAFTFVGEDPDIFIACSEQYREEEGLFIAGHGGPKVIINSTMYSVITKGTIKLFSESCGYNVELHEILHVLGFDHSPNPQSIMYNVSSCDQQLTDDILEELNRLYSIPDLPDLYFQNVSSLKRGRYLNIHFSVLNQGLVDASNIHVILYADRVKVDEFFIEDIEIGAGKIISAQNLRLPSHVISSLKLIIDEEDQIEELDERNNVIEMIPG